MAEKLEGSRGRLVKTYLTLINMAERRETVTYGDLADLIGVANQAVGRLCLNPVWEYCEANGLPDLTSIVVNGSTGEPAEGHFNPRTVYRIRETVYEFPWTDYSPPEIN